MDCSMPGLPVHHQLSEFTQTHVHWVSDAIQPSQPPSSPSPPTFNLSQHQGLFKRVSSSHQVAKVLDFSFSISPSNEYSGLISFRRDWLDLLTVQRTFKSLSQHHSSKASILQCSAFFIVQLSHPYMNNGKTIALTRRIFVGKVMSLLFNMLSRLVITFLPRSKHLLISWLQSPSAWILEPKKIKPATVSTVSPSICHEVMGLDATILVFWMLSFKPTFSLFSFTFIKRLIFFSCENSKTTTPCWTTVDWRMLDPTKKIPHVQGPRRSPSKMAVGVKLHLESNPLPTRDAQRAQTNLVCNRTQRHHRDLSQKCAWVTALAGFKRYIYSQHFPLNKYPIKIYDLFSGNFI